jgi:F0F1-type ATP synthase membrane subunit b/b'
MLLSFRLANWMILILLILAIGISKEILVFNEESLVAGSFIAFVIFAYMNMSDLFVDTLEERSIKVKKEFDSYYSLQEEILKLLISYHEKRKNLSEEIKKISTFSKKEIEYILSKRQVSLEHNIAQQTQQKLRTVFMKELDLIQRLQLEASSWFSKNVYDQFKSSSQVTNEMKDFMIKDGIQMIHQISKNRRS